MGKELDFGTDVCLKALLHLRVGKDDQRNFWVRNRKNLYKCLGTKRNNVITSMKKGFMGKWYQENMEYTLSISNCIFVLIIARVDEGSRGSGRRGSWVGGIV
jgi:hypothetical protein